MCEDIMHILYLDVCIVPAGCNADRVKIDGISVIERSVSVVFSSDPNARFRCRLNHRRYRKFRKCEESGNMSDLS